MPVLFLVLGGLPFPGGAVYVDDGALRGRRWSVAVAAAGPGATLLFALLVCAPFFFDWQGWVTEKNYHFWPALAFLALIQVASFCFNLLPIPRSTASASSRPGSTRVSCTDFTTTRRCSRSCSCS